MSNKPGLLISVLMLCGLLIASVFGWMGLVIVLVAFTGLALAFYLLDHKPEWYLLLMIFFFYRGFYIIDTDVVFRLPGVFKAKDVLLVGWLGFWMLREISRLPPKLKMVNDRFGKDPLCFAFKLLGVLGAVILVYTIFYLKEPWLLAVRSAREFLSYFWPLLAYRLLTREQLQRFFKLLVGLVIIGLFFSLVKGGMRGVEEYGSGSMFGVIRFQNWAESLAYLSLIFFVVCWMMKPSWRYFIGAALFSMSILAFLYRARIAGMCVGVAITILFLHGKERLRLLLLMALAPIFLLLLLGMYGAATGIGFSNYIENFFDFFAAVKDNDLSGVTFRMTQLAERLPLLEKYPFFGIGFLGPYGKIAWALYYKGYMPLGFVDAGWADLLLKYGYVGTPVFVFFYLFSAFLAIKRYRVCKGVVARAANLSVLAFVVMSFCTLYSYNYMGFEAVYITFSLLNIFAFFEYAKERDAEETKEQQSEDSSQRADSERLPSSDDDVVVPLPGNRWKKQSFTR